MHEVIYTANTAVLGYVVLTIIVFCVSIRLGGFRKSTLYYDKAGMD